MVTSSWTAAVGVLSALVCTSGTALAQWTGPQASGVPIVGPVLGPPRVTWLSFTPGDAKDPGDGGHVPSFVLDPIRLGLLGSAVPKGAAEPGCRDGVEATAATGSFAMQRAAPFQLVPGLTLYGFSRGGCAFDTGIGVALVYAAPLRKNIWFVASAGALNLPHAGPGGTSVTTAQVRADVVFARPKGRSYSVGVGTHGVSFGGGF